MNKGQQFPGQHGEVDSHTKEHEDLKSEPSTFRQKVKHICNLGVVWGQTQEDGLTNTMVTVLP